jgi:hypothetical protein
VITIEDPIEKKNDAFIQMEVNEKADFTYAKGFRAILRHDPDMIMTASQKRLYINGSRMVFNESDHYLTTFVLFLLIFNRLERSANP